MTPRQARLLRRRLEERAHEFELAPLVLALERLGISRHEIKFRSAADPGGGSAVVVRVVFEDNPRSRWRALVVVNDGLMGADPLLPAYFRELLRTPYEPKPGEPGLDIDQESGRFYAFIGFLDDCLLHGRVRALLPENETFGGLEWEGIQRAYCRAAMVPAVTCLAHLFRRAFPELRIQVGRAPMTDALTVPGAIVGEAPLDGSSVLGNTYGADISGFLVDLIAEDEFVPESNESWASLVRRRFTARLEPHLARMRAPVVVRLVIESHRRTLRLGGLSELGYDRLGGTKPRPHAVMVCRYPRAEGN